MAQLNAKGTLRVSPTAKPKQPAWKPPPMPSCLPIGARVEYRRVCKNLYQEGLWHDDRLPLVVAYVAGSHALQEIVASIVVEGVTLPDGKKNPAMVSYPTVVNTLAKAGACLGLTVVRSQPIVKEEPTVASKTKGVWAEAVRK